VVGLEPPWHFQEFTVGFDVSAHPVDVDLIQKRLLPYVRGEGDITDLVETAVRLAQVRFRANAWGLGLLKLSRAESEAKRNETGAGKEPVAERKWLVPESFVSHLHVWGRPFFITSPTERVSEAVDRYLAATPGQVDSIAEGMLRELNPALPGNVTPSTEGKLPGPEQLAKNVRHALDFYRAAYPKLKTGERVELPDGDDASPEELFLTSFALDVVTFAANLQPGWMSRGYVWFTAFIARARLDAGEYVESAASLFQPLLQEVDGYREAFEATITENYTVGGYVRPNNVPAFRQWMEQNAEKMIAACVADGWDEDGARADLLKVMEPLRDAERREMGFLEATEVYSGLMGIMN
jgi:hypothetical protein